MGCIHPCRFLTFRPHHDQKWGAIEVGDLCISGIDVSVGSCVGNDVTVGADIGIAVCVSTTAVLTVEMAVSITPVGLIAGVDKKPLQDVNIVTVRNKGIIALPMILTFPSPLMFCNETPNGMITQP